MLICHKLKTNDCFVFLSTGTANFFVQNVKKLLSSHGVPQQWAKFHILTSINQTDWPISIIIGRIL